MRPQARTCVFLVAAVLSLGVANACSRSNAPDALAEVNDEEPRTIAPGTSFVFSVDERVSTATHARGDIFSATLRHRVSDIAGDEAIPEGVPSQWIVAEASTDGGETVLAVRLESIRVDGTWTPIVGDVIEAHIRAPSHEATLTDSGTDSGKVAIGDAARKLLAEVLGRDRSAPIDASGTMVTLTTRGESAILPEGSAITVQLTEPLEV